MTKGKFSVIIPTLQRSPRLWELLDRLPQDPLVGEVVVINNAPEPIADRPGVRVLNQPENLYVNPSWNLGVREARHSWLCIANDDITFDPGLFGRVAPWMRMPIGILGPRGIGPMPTGLRLRPRMPLTRPHGFGVLMFMRRERYVQIPDAMKVWFGDDFLFAMQRWPNVTFDGRIIETEMSATTKDLSFVRMYDDDAKAFVGSHPRVTSYNTFCRRMEKVRTIIGRLQCGAD